jgi:hypothetical protein
VPGSGKNEIVATPSASRFAEPTDAVPLANVTEPCGTVPLVAVTIAESVSVWPKEREVAEAFSVVVVGEGLMVTVTGGDEEDEAYALEPAKLAVSDSVPTVGVKAKVATPLAAKSPLPSAVAPS